MTNKTTQTKETIFPIVVAILSVFNIYNQLPDLLTLSSLLSCVGLAGTIFYFRKNDLFRTLFYVWIMAQVIVIDRAVLDVSTNTWQTKPIFDLTQVISLKFGLSFISDAGKLGLNINFAALLFLGLLKILEVASLIGSQLTFHQFRQDSQLGDIFPLEGTVLKRVTLSKEKDWLLVGLSNSFDYEAQAISHVLVKNKDQGAIRLKVDNQLIYFRLVSDVDKLQNGDNDGSKFPFVDWVLCT